MGTGVPRQLDFALASAEDLSDFASLPWAQALWQDSSYTPIVNRIRRRPGPTDSEATRRAFLTSTLWTPTTIRASQCFYKGPLPSERWSGPPRTPESQDGLGSCKMLFSLGEGLTGGQAGSAHGGLMATLLDEALGMPVFVQTTTGCATADLRVQYAKPLPLPGVVLCRSWILKVEGRKVWIEAVIEDGMGNTFAKGESLYIKLKSNI